MAYIRPYRVAETTTTTGTGSITLAGAVTGYSSFAGELANADTATIVIEAIDAAGVPTGEWEICDTTFTSPSTLSRGTLRDSSTGSRINFGAGTKRVFAISPRDAINLGSADVTGTLAVANGGTGVTTSTGSGSVVLSTSPALTTPNLGTPSAATLTNATGLPIVAGTTGTLTVARGGTGTTGTPTNGQLLIGNGTGFTLTNLAQGAGITITNGAGFIAISGTGGTVTSVNGSGGTTGLTLTGGPITTSGTLTIGGTLAVANGGTGATTLSGVVIGNGTSAFTTKTNPSGAFVGTTDTQTLTAKTFGNYTETVFAITDGATVNLDPNNGPIQTWTLGANRTPGQANWAAGQSITLMVDDGTAFSITWSTLAVVWKSGGGMAPTLNTTGFTVIVLWKVGTTIYGARVGDA